MKILIWIGTFFIGTLLNTILGYATGIKAGVVLLYILEYFIARKLCEKWDEKQNQKKSGNQRCGSCGYNSFDDEGKSNDCNNSMEVRFEEKNVQLRETINAVSDEKEIEKCEMCDQVTDELLSAKIVDSVGTRFRKLCSNCVAKYNAITNENQNNEQNATNQKINGCKPVFCRICGSKLIDDSSFCSKCGTKVEE